MIRPHLFLIFWFALSLVSCTQKQKSDSVQIKDGLGVPDYVKVDRNEDDYQFPGTKVFISAPSEFEPVPSFVTLMKENENTVITCLETPANFVDQKSSFTQAIDKLIEQGFKLKYKKLFKLGESEALIIHGGNPSNTKDNLFLVFGDTSFAAMLEGKFASQDTSSRNEILSALLTAYYDKDSEVDYSQLIHFSIDLSESQFQLQSHVNQLFVYTIDGRGKNINDVGYENHFVIYSYPALKSFQKLLDLSGDIVLDGANEETMNKRFYDLNGSRAYEISYDILHEGRESKAYQIALGDEKGAVIFAGQAYHDQDETIKHFMEICQTLRTKRFDHQ